MADDEQVARSEKLKLIFLHFDTCLLVVDSLPTRGAKLRALTVVLEKLTDKLQSLAPPG